MTTTARPLLVPTIATAALMPAYLLLRPYGDKVGDAAPAISAFTDPAWVFAHLCGILALAAFAVLVGRLARTLPGRGIAVAGALALPSAVLTALYFGAETFALAVVAGALPQAEALSTIEAIRNHPAALVVFGLGLLGLAVAALLAAWAWQRADSRHGWALWPLAVLVALVLPQFYLPVGGRMAFGVVYALAGVLFAWAVIRRWP